MPTIELYTSKLEITITHKTAKLAVVISATRGTVEDVNEAMNEAVKVVRSLDQGSSTESDN